MQAPSKQPRNPTGFRIAHPRSQDPTPANASSSTSTTSRVRMLVVGPNGRLASKRKDRSHVTTQPSPSTPPPIQADTTLEDDVTADVAEPPEVQVASVEEVIIVEKPKRKRDNKTRVCIYFLGNH